MNWKKALVCLLCSAVILFSVNLPGAYASGHDTIIFPCIERQLGDESFSRKYAHCCRWNGLSLHHVRY